MTEQVCAVAIMAKASIAGTVKTRLVPPLTYEEAAELNTCCLADVAANIVAASGQESIQAVAAYSPVGSEQFFADVLSDNFKLLPPKEPTLGRSLFHAAQDLFTEGYGLVCLVNADSPTLPTRMLVEAVRRLRQPGDRVVLGPAADGGYYMIGLKQFHGGLFEEIDWSTERVYQQTVSRASQLGLAVSALPQWYDVDDDQSLALLMRELFSASDAVIAYTAGYAAPKTAALLKKLSTTNGDLKRLVEHSLAREAARSRPVPTRAERGGRATGC